MAQPIKNKKINNNHHQTSSKAKRKHKHPDYGTSKLEKEFAENFLDKLGVQYQYQYKAEEIGRYYDFCVTLPSGSKVLIEIDGDYW